MRAKSPKLVITFDTTAAAMALERLCAGEGSLGRIIPTPQAISAGCGLSWCAPIEARDTLRVLLQQNRLNYADMTVVELY